MNSKTMISIFIDFDGTITKRDTLQFLLDEFSRENWRRVEEQVDRGELDEAQALQMEMDLIDASMEEALCAIDRAIEVDPHFKGFLDWCKGKGFAVTIVSGGFRKLIDHVLSREVRNGVSVLANEITVQGNRWLVVPLGKWENCRRCNHCKRTAVLEARRAGNITVYIGNGNTDICPAQEADMVIARDRLATALKEKGRSYHLFNDFRNVKNHLADALSEITNEQKN